MKHFKQDQLPLECIGSFPRTENLCPRYDAKQMSDLVNFLKSGGDVPPIIISEKYQIIDGYNRYRAHNLADLDTILCEIFSYASEDEMEIHGILLNAKRHHFDSVTLGRMAVRLAELMKPKQEEIKEKQKRNANNQHVKKEPCPTPVGQGSKREASIEKAAKEVGVSPQTARIVKKVDETKDETLISAMESREISLEKAAMFAGIKDPQERKRIVKKYLDDCEKILAPMKKISETLKGDLSNAVLISAACMDCLIRLGKADKQIKYELMTALECDHQLNAVNSVANKLLEIKTKIQKQEIELKHEQ